MIGRTLGSYKIVSELGAGGMGVVYVAEHPLIGRKAAVKLLLPEYSNNKDLVDRFFNEARAATVVKHRGIVDIFDFGYTEDNRAFIVMEFLEGESLADRVKHGRLEIGEAMRIARQVASALGAAHEAGIIHRDLKPDNVFIIRDSEVAGGERIKVLDFGIAKLSKHRDPGASKTQTGQLMGSPLYMAPEQCRGAGAVDGRADVYSLGCVMYEMVSGRPIFDGQAAGEVIAKQIYETPDPPSAFVSGIPPAIEWLIMRALEKQPDARFASMREVIEAIDMATQGQYAAPAGKPRQYTQDAIAETVAPSEPPHMMHTPVPTPTPFPQHTAMPTPLPGPLQTPLPGQVHGPLPTPVPGPTQTTLGTAASEMTAAGFETQLQRSRRRRLGLLGAAVGAIAIGGGIFAVASGGGDETTASSEAAEPEATEVASPTPAPVEQPPAAALPADAGGEPAEPATVTIKIESAPNGAAVYRVSDGVRIGTTPFTKEFSRSEGTLDLLLKRRDHRDEPLSVSLLEDRSYMASLEPKRSSSSHGSHRPTVKPPAKPEKPVAKKPEPKKPAEKPIAKKPEPEKPAEKPVAQKPEPKKPDKEPLGEKPKPRKDKEWGKTYNPLEE